MNHPAGYRPGRDRDAGLVFWYGLPVIGGGIALAFALVGWLTGS